MSTKKTSLYDHHLKLNAKMAEFAGFEMPLQYGPIKDEVLNVRNKVGVFDVSHMGEFFVEGPEAHKFIDYLITNDFCGVGDLKAVYSPLCHENGTVVDDLIAYKISGSKVLICVNASNIEKDWRWISSKISGFNCNISNRSDDYSLLAVQGPGTEELFKKLELLDDQNVSYYSVREKIFREEEVILARTGYTGEDGFEVFCSHKMAVNLWETLLENGVTPCGLVSRDVLRLEVCYPLYGHELSDEITPIDSGLKWAVKFKKDDFIGKEAMSIKEARYRLVKLSLEKGIPRDGYLVENIDGDTIGKVTSGTMSVTIGKGIAIALIEKDKFPEDNKFFIKIRKNSVQATLNKKPFVTGGHK